MEFPQFYNPNRVGQLFIPNTAQAVDAGVNANVSPASEDKVRIALLLVDVQVDFVHEDGALSVPGAVDDTRRTVEWIYRHVNQITTIAASLDSHIPLQIFFPTWWVDEDGNHPAPFTPISVQDVQSGKWRPLYEEAWSREYVERLEEQAKKLLMIWPYHTLIGTPGHALTPALYEAIAFHAAARRTQPQFLTKGTLPKTEHYSILEPEVKVEGNPMGVLNVEFLNMLKSHDVIYVAGQAKSHCVLETVASLVRHMGEGDGALSRIHLLTDCMSSVVHPEIDFEAIANETFARFAEHGVQLVTSTDPIAS